MNRDIIPPENVVVIGSGIGGLSTGIILAKLGYPVTVVEKNPRPGGLMRSYPRLGMECPVGIHYMGALGKGQILRRMLEYLGVMEDIPLEKMGENGIIDRYHFPDFSFDLPEGFEQLEENLAKTFPEETGSVKTIMKLLKTSARELDSLDFLFSGKPLFHMIDRFRPFGEVLEELECSPGLRAVLGVTSCWIGVPLDNCPIFYHNMALASYVFSSWRLKCSGSEMAEAFSSRLSSLGGKIICNDSVCEIRVESGKVKSVTLGSGQQLTADTVVAAIHPRLVIEMIPEGVLKPSYRKRIRNLENTHGIFCVHASVDASKHKEIPHNIFDVKTDNSGTIDNIKFIQLRKSEQKDKHLLSILTSGDLELWKPWHFTITGRRGKEYEAKKKERGMNLIKEVEPLVGKFHGLKLVDTYTPLSVRDWVNSPEGSAYGIRRSEEQMLSTSLLNRTSIKGLYLAGQNVTAPGIVGTLVGTLNTVKTMIGQKDFEKHISL